MISVNESGGGRGANIKSTTATPIGESLKTVTNQLLQAPEATDMVATDIRTPPRVKIQHRTEGISQPGKGEAFPIALEEIQSNPIKPISQNGNASWVLLTNGNQTVPNKKKVSTQPSSDHKILNVIGSTGNTGVKIGDVTKFDRKPALSNKPVVGTKKPNSTKEESTKSPSAATHESKLKNRPLTAGKVPSIQKDKNNSNLSKYNATQSAYKDTAGGKNKSVLNVPTTTPTIPTTIKNIPVHLPDIVPTTSLLIETGPVEAIDEKTTEATSTTTKQTRRPGNKKKKKNKNRRRRPTKTQLDQLESKITPEHGSNSSKIDGNTERPLSTRIYNYLAREVMPSVGVGIVGLVLTAGLAGLLLYPFGGGIARRNYDKIPGSSPDGHMYYYNDYSPGIDPDQGNTQAEEAVFGQVLSGMNSNSYPNTYSSQKYNNYRYDTYDYNNANINTYAGSSEYSTLPDSVKNTDYSSMSENSKFYGIDNLNAQEKPADNIPQSDQYNVDNNMKYPELTKYTAYTSAASVGTSGTYDKIHNENKKDGIEDKSDKSQPQFSALVGSPQFSGYVGSVSVSGSYGTDHHRQGALALEHGPRSLDIKSRKVREITDDIQNEIDDNYYSSQGSFQEDINKKTKPHEDKKNNNISNIDSLNTTNTVTHPDNNKKVSEGTYGLENGSSNTDANSPPNQGEQFNFMDMFRKVAHMKLKLGINFLRSTANVFQQYLDNIMARMETAMHNLENNEESQNSQTYTYKSRNKRDLKSGKKNRVRKVGKKYKSQ